MVSVIKLRLGIAFWFLCLVILAAINTAPLHAQSSATEAAWINNFRIQFAGDEYISDDNNRDWVFYRIDDPDGCRDQIYDMQYNPFRRDQDAVILPSDDTVKLQRFVPDVTGCVEDGPEIDDIRINNPEAAAISFGWAGNSIVELNEQYRVFTFDPALGVYIWQDDPDEGPCRDSIQAAHQGASNITITVRKHQGRLPKSDGDKSESLMGAYSGHSWVSMADFERTINDCYTSEPVTVNNVTTDAAQLPPGVTPDSIPSGDGAAAGGSQPENSCESKSGPMGWIMCPVILAIDGGLDWVDSRINALLTIDQNYYDNPELKQAWASIRNIAYIILVPIMLVMVISTALGYDFVSAYTVKKALPRLVAATIFISLSYNICVFLIEFFNAVGSGAVGIATSPFETRFGELTLASLFEGNIFMGIITGLTGAIAFIIVLWLFGGTLLLAAITAFFILLLRQIFIVALLLVAPLAILAWIFPGNDKLWKAWWGSFSKLLMMYPIIMILIAVGRIFAFIIHNSDSAGLDGAVLVPIMKIMAYMLPYAFIPFTFKLAGGTFATLAGIANDKEKGLFDRARQNRARKWERGLLGGRIGSRGILQTRANAARALNERASRGNALSRLAFRSAARRVGGYNIEAAASAKQAAVGKELNDQIATGRDDAIRGLTVNKKLADSTTASRQITDENGKKIWQSMDENGNWQRDDNLDNALVRVDADGRRQYKSLGGGWVDEAYVHEGHRRWGNDRFAQQAALSYEMRKAMTSRQVGDLSVRYRSLAKDAWGMTDTEAGGAWIGSAFENQNQHLEYKYTDWSTGALKDSGFVNEIYEKRGSYPLSQMSAHTIQQLSSAYDAAERTGDTVTMGRVREITETFMMRGGGIQGMEGEGETARPVQAQGGISREPVVSAPGSAHVNQAVQGLARHIGLLPNAPAPTQPPDPGTRPGDGGVIL